MTKVSGQKLGATFALRLTSEQADAVKRLATLSGRGTSAVLRQVLELAIDPPRPELVFQSAGQAASAIDTSARARWTPSHANAFTWTGTGHIPASAVTLLDFNAGS